MASDTRQCERVNVNIGQRTNEIVCETHTHHELESMWVPTKIKQSCTHTDGSGGKTGRAHEELAKYQSKGKGSAKGECELGVIANSTSKRGES